MIKINAVEVTIHITEYRDGTWRTVHLFHATGVEEIRDILKWEVNPRHEVTIRSHNNFDLPLEVYRMVYLPTALAYEEQEAYYANRFDHLEHVSARATV